MKCAFVLVVRNKVYQGGGLETCSQKKCCLVKFEHECIQQNMLASRVNERKKPHKNSFHIYCCLNSLICEITFLRNVPRRCVARKHLQWLLLFVSSTRSVHFFVHLFNFLTERLTRIFWGLRSRRAWVRVSH